jgi:hypothetical protein
VYGSPVNVPLCALFDAACVAAVVAVAVAAAVALFVVAGFADFVATGFVVEPDFVAVGVGLPAAAVVCAGAGMSSKPEPEVFEDSCGGVIAMTAPKPPTVPPAINHARFISELSPGNL